MSARGIDSASQESISTSLKEVALSLVRLREELRTFTSPKPADAKAVEPKAPTVQQPGVSPTRAGTKKKSSTAGSSITVFLAVNVRRLFNLDTVRQTFGVQILIQMMWKAPPGEDLPVAGDTDWEPNWVPTYRFRRLMEEKMKVSMFHARETNGDLWITMENDHLLELYEQLELQSFPVDAQDLCIELVSLLDTDSVEWTPWIGEPGGAMCHMAIKHVCLNDFSLIHEIPFSHSLSVETGEKRVSVFAMHVKTCRNATYYMCNVAFVMCVIVSFTLCAWASHPASIEDRHAVDFNLVLTAVAFKLFLSTLLPPVSYITLLDVYLWVCLGFLTSATMCHTLLPWQYIKMIDNSPLTLPPTSNDDEEDLIDADRLLFWVFLISWIVVNCLYFIYLFFHQKRTRREFVKDSLEEQKQNNEALESMYQKNSGLNAPRKTRRASIAAHEPGKNN